MKNQRSPELNGHEHEYQGEQGLDLMLHSGTVEDQKNNNTALLQIIMGQHSRIVSNGPTNKVFLFLHQLLLFEILHSNKHLPLPKNLWHSKSK